MGGAPLLAGVIPVLLFDEYLKLGISLDNAEEAAAWIEFILACKCCCC
jgi:hypothetical protein